MIPSTRLTKIISQICILCLVLLACFIDVTPVSAVSIIVNTTNDEEINDTVCSLREAIHAAVTGADYYGCTGGASAWVTLPAGDYTVDTGSLPPIEHAAITIHGAGASNTVIQAADCNPVEESCSFNHRLFYIAGSGSLTIEDLTIRNAYVDGSDGGGAIWNNEGTLNIYSSVFSANRSQRGGAIKNFGTLYITESTFSSNMVGIEEPGGAIYTSTDTQSIFIENSAFSDNSAADGGAISSSSSSGVLEIENCTFSGNTAGIFGGAITISSTATAILTNNTFTENSAPSGAGVYAWSSADVSLINNIIANALSGSDCAISGTISINESNLIEDGSCGAGYTGDPLLGPLADNGGPTQTHALLPGSIALDNANMVYCSDTDQRGVKRPQGEGCDIGAYEWVPPIYLPLIMR